MSIFTALKLSLKNLITKKGRTIITSFAGSIGIIGIGLILSVSNGTTGYINTVQEESLSSYPLTIRSTDTDILSLFNSMSQTRESDTKHEEAKVFEKSILYNILDGFVNSSSSENDLKSFKTYIDAEIAKEDSNLNKAVKGVGYHYGLDIPIYTRNTNGDILESNMSKLVNSIFAQYASGIGSTTASGNDSNSLITSLLESTNSLTLWEEMLPGLNGDPVSEYVKNQYDVVYGTWPSKYNDIVVVLNDNNEIIDTALYSLGLKDQKDITTIIAAVLDPNAKMPELNKFEMSFEDICKKEYKTLLPGDCFTYNEQTKTYIDTRSTKEGLDFLYAHNGTNLNITGVIKPKQGVTSPMLAGTIGYTSLLTKKIIEGATNSTSVKAQIESKNIDIFNNLPFKENTYSDEEKQNSFKNIVNEGSDKSNSNIYINIKCIMPQDQLDAVVNSQTQGLTAEQIRNILVQAMKQQLSVSEEQLVAYVNDRSDEEIMNLYKQVIITNAKSEYAKNVRSALEASMTEDQRAAALKAELPTYTNEQLVLYFDEALEFSTSSYEKNLIKLGKVDLANPSSILIYTDSFANKDIIIDEIAKYNDSVEESKKIKYTDIMGVLMSAVNTIINAITYVLIAFVSISLIVSSIMIAIITLISVQERTKEIGILRAIGASKRNVSNMFNAETIAIGFSAGLIGVLICYLLIIPINLVIHALTGLTTLSASLPILYALILVLISMFLTVISGFIPSRSAAKKDPVVALRTE